MTEQKKKGKWSVLTVLAMASFIMVIDSTSMNVSISYLVNDLNTDIGTIQTIMSMYTLIMAAFMLPGAKIADIFGSRKVFIAGVCIYGIGTLTAAVSVNTTMLFIGWAVIEGLASSLMMPTALSLISSAYSGKERAVAMSIYAAMASVALAIGPIFGGLITTYLSWRFVFALEVAIVVFIVLRYKTILGIDAPEGDRTQKFDIPGTLLCIAALFLVIQGGLLLQTSRALAVVMILLGAVTLLILFKWLFFAKAKGRPVLVDVAIFKSRTYNFVLLINLCIQMCMMGIMFVTSIYLQNVLRYNALSTGLSMLPLSVVLFCTALVVVKVTEKIAEHFVVAFGGGALLIGALYMFTMLNGNELVTGVQMIPAMALLGLGIGCSLSLTSNIGLSSLESKYANQASGTLTTVNNLGSSMSTAILGSVFMLSIKPNIVSSAIRSFPDKLGAYTAEEAGTVLKAAFDKVNALPVTIEQLSPEQVQKLTSVVIGGINVSMRTIFTAVMFIALVAVIVAATFLKTNKPGRKV